MEIEELIKKHIDIKAVVADIIDNCGADILHPGWDNPNNKVKVGEFELPNDLIALNYFIHVLQCEMLLGMIEYGIEKRKVKK